MKLQVKNRKKAGRFTNMWKLKNTLLNSQWVKEDLKKAIKWHLETNENANTAHQTYGCCESKYKKEVQ